MVKSPAEQSFLRRAATISDAGAAAAIELIRPGENERSIAAACGSAMIEAGGTFPGFGRFIRSFGRLGDQHTSWTSRRVEEGDAVFLELSGCVARYHAPLGRLLQVGRAPREACEIAGVCRDAFEALVGTLRKGTPLTR